MLRTVAGLLSISLLGLPATAQKPAELILASIDSVDARIMLTWDKQIENPTEDMMQSRLETVFELELRHQGITVSKNAPNSLNVILTVLYNGDGTVSYSNGLRLYEFGVPDRVIGEVWETAYKDLNHQRLDRLRTTDSVRASLEVRAALWDEVLKFYSDSGLKRGAVVTWWGASGVGHVGKNKLQDALETQTRELAQEFANAYLAAHPKGER